MAKKEIPVITDACCSQIASISVYFKYMKSNPIDEEAKDLNIESKTTESTLFFSTNSKVGRVMDIDTGVPAFYIMISKMMAGIKKPKFSSFKDYIDDNTYACLSICLDFKDNSKFSAKAINYSLEVDGLCKKVSYSINTHDDKGITSTLSAAFMKENAWLYEIIGNLFKFVKLECNLGDEMVDVAKNVEAAIKTVDIAPVYLVDFIGAKPDPVASLKNKMNSKTKYNIILC